jgi:hypothetical protein
LNVSRDAVEDEEEGAVDEKEEGGKFEVGSEVVPLEEVSRTAATVGVEGGGAVDDAWIEKGRKQTDGRRTEHECREGGKSASNRNLEKRKVRTDVKQAELRHDHENRLNKKINLEVVAAVKREKREERIRMRDRKREKGRHAQPVDAAGDVGDDEDGADIGAETGGGMLAADAEGGRRERERQKKGERRRRKEVSGQ